MVSLGGGRSQRSFRLQSDASSGLHRKSVQPTLLSPTAESLFSELILTDSKFTGNARWPLARGAVLLLGVFDSEKNKRSELRNWGEEKNGIKGKRMSSHTDGKKENEERCRVGDDKKKS